MNRSHPWMPVSPCGEGCLPPPAVVPSVSWARRLPRLLAAAMLLLAGAAVLPLLGPPRRERALRAWCRALLRALGITLEITGGERFATPGVGVLVVSNHMSWLDLIALGAVQPLRMVAKSEVRGWPVLGSLARRMGTVFLERERLSTLPRTVEAVLTHWPAVAPSARSRRAPPGAGLPADGSGQRFSRPRSTPRRWCGRWRCATAWSVPAPPRWPPSSAPPPWGRRCRGWPECGAWWWPCGCCRRCPPPVPTVARWRPAPRPPSPR